MCPVVEKSSPSRKEHGDTASKDGIHLPLGYIPPWQQDLEYTHSGATLQIITEGSTVIFE
jgi:hypothetical protein